MKRCLLVSIVLATLLGCATDPRLSSDAFKPEIEGAQAARQALVGAWYGEATIRDGLQRRWVNRRSADGTYVLEVRLSGAASESPDREYGVWGVSGGIYFTIMQGWIDAGGTITPSDPADANFYDAYRVLELTGDVFRYRGLETGNTFTVTRVADDFSL